MKEHDEIAGLFRNQLAETEMNVRPDFWEELQRDLPVSLASTAASKKYLPLSPRLYRATAAASVLLVLGAASAAFWHFSPEEEIKEAFTQVAALTADGSLKGDVAQETFPSIHEVAPTAKHPAHQLPASGGAPFVATALAQKQEQETVSMQLSITITQRRYGNHTTTTHRISDVSEIDAVIASAQEAASAEATQPIVTPCDWAIKAGIGTSLSKGHFNLPLTAAATVERRLNKRLSLETGLQYSALPAGNEMLHTLALPVKMNLLLASIKKVDLYATVGGAVEKCIAGAVDNSFEAQPAQLSVMAGVGVCYNMNDRFALFAQPSVSHYFTTDARANSLRTERPTNVNLLCGVRMSY